MATKKKKTKSRTTKKPAAKKKSVAKKRKPNKKTVKKKTAAKKKTASKRKTTAKKSAAKKRSTRKPAAKKRSVSKKKSSASRRKTKSSTKKKSAPARIAFSRSGPLNGTSLAGLNYRALEAEISKLTDLLQTIRKKNKLVKKSLAYLEKEQKKVAKQIQDAKKYLTQLKNRGIKVLREFPDNAEDIFYQLKGEITRISRRLGIG